VNDALMGFDQWRQLGEKHSTDGGQIALHVQHAGESGEVGLEPVLFGIALRRESQIVDHGVEVVFQISNRATGFHWNGAGYVTLGDGGSDLSDGAYLI